MVCPFSAVHDISTAEAFIKQHGSSIVLKGSSAVLEFDDRMILPQTKNGEGRIVYLNRFAQSALESLPLEGTRPTDLLFPQITAERVSVAFRRTVRRLGIVNFRFHDLRHTAAS